MKTQNVAAQEKRNEIKKKKKEKKMKQQNKINIYLVLRNDKPFNFNNKYSKKMHKKNH